MIYLEHYLREGGVKALSTVAILGPAAAPTCKDIAAEILDLYPAANVRLLLPQEPPPRCDLLVVAFDTPARFPLHDAVYENLDRLEDLVGPGLQAASIMIHGASWRSVEVFPSRELGSFVRKRRAEARFIRLLERSRLLRRLLRPLLRPLYP